MRMVIIEQKNNNLGLMLIAILSNMTRGYLNLSHAFLTSQVKKDLPQQHNDGKGKYNISI